MTAAAIEATETLTSFDSAAGQLGVKPATVRRYVRSGRLAGIPGLGVWADSVEAYAARRDASVARTRACPGWRRPAPAVVAPMAVLPTSPVEVTDVESAAAAYAEGLRLAALGEALKKRARPFLDAAGEGQHGAWHVRFTEGKEINDVQQIKDDYAARGESVPTRRAKPSIKVTPVAA